jgi:hypothetical protein
MSTLQKENELSKITPVQTVQTRTVEIKPGETFRVGEDGYTHIELHRRNTKNLQLEFFIEFNKDGKKSSHGSEVLTHEGKEHRLNLEKGTVTWKIADYNKKTDTYTIEITDQSNYKMK